MQEGETLIVKLGIRLRDDERDRERRRILREIEEGVVLLQAFEEPVIVPKGLEVRMEEGEA